MKRIVFLTVLALASVVSSASAQMMGPGQSMMQGYDRQPNYPPPQQQPYPPMMHPNMMGPYGMIGPQMMGNYPMGQQMMGGYGPGPQMMGPYGMHNPMIGRFGNPMGPSMMGKYGYLPHMAGSCWGYGYGYGEGKSGAGTSEDFEKFLDDTKELRKKLHAMKFDYMEMLRNPNATIEDRIEMEKEMFELQQQLQQKAVQ